MPTSAPLLDLNQVGVHYGELIAVQDFSLTIVPGEVVALLGANGAGKTSLLNAACGVVPLATGSVRLRGQMLVEPVGRLVRNLGGGALSHRVVRSGMALVPEGRRVVAPLTVLENLQLAGGAAHRRRGKDFQDGLTEVFTLFPRLAERRQQLSGLLSGGEQQMLAIGRAVMARPDVLMIDEPSMGLAPIVIQEIYGLLRDRQGTLGRAALLLAEQSSPLALAIADTACVLSRGRQVYCGPASQLTDRHMRDAYLGNVQVSSPQVATPEPAIVPQPGTAPKGTDVAR
jgi:branched-chain amino acid transport system ATP-binding protein